RSTGGGARSHAPVRAGAPPGPRASAPKARRAKARPRRAPRSLRGAAENESIREPRSWRERTLQAPRPRARAAAGPKLDIAGCKQANHLQDRRYAWLNPDLDRDLDTTATPVGACLQSSAARSLTFRTRFVASPWRKCSGWSARA